VTQLSSERERRWLKRLGPPRESAHTRLYCFHYAGGAASMFRPWGALLPGSVEPVAVQLPGRADRFLEAPYDRMKPLVDDLVEVLAPHLHRPFACYGVSMGARVAWALAHALRERAMPMPTALFVAASGAPTRDNGDWRWEGRADGLEGYVREMGGTPPAVLAEPKLLAALLPTLHADLTVLSTHGFQAATPLAVPMRAFAGADDDEATPDRMAAWGAETAAAFDLDVLACGHFFDPAAERRVIETVARDLAADRASSRTDPSDGSAT
jgi:surfactin synthase thioesterase subunit